ncbi:cell wall-binding repeat-containing protein [Cohnella algarum]|uniref:cell wall-binding repeat-containing protein n=1 Tax=Cohnella algarum TaxID=2044859 RepID=UPI00196783A3|nr:cell wall-binding repeat-containing protein [Cohnella algarum]MBN2981762.1 cell wall-binding repeat-containing protein [Cohnella algarum]
MWNNIIASTFVGLLAVTLIGCASQDNGSPAASPPPATTQSNQSETGNPAFNPLPWMATKNTTRINTSDPVEAAVFISRTLWPATSESNRPGGVILVAGDSWQNALVSADLIHHPINGPILFVDENGIPDLTREEMMRLKPTGLMSNKDIQVIVAGPVNDRVMDDLNSLGLKADRIEGNTPAALAQAIDDYYAKAAGNNLPPSVIVGSLDSPEYTVPAVNWIAHMPEPLLFVNKDAVPDETTAALKKRNGKANIYIIGPESVVSAKVEKELSSYGKVVRIAGNDPYLNAIAFAKYKDTSNDFGWGITTPGHNFSFVEGKSFMLAIAAAPFSHLGKHAPLLWTDQNQMPESVMTYLMSVQPKYKKSPTEGPYNHVWLTGEEDLLSAQAQGEIDGMLEIVSATGEGHGMPGMEDENQGNESSGHVMSK